MSRPNFGHFKLTIGPMFAGKTTETLAEIERYMIAGRQCILVKYSKDTRFDAESGSDKIMTHSGRIFDKCEIISSDDLAKVPTDNVDVIGVTEIQFYKNVVESIKNWRSAGKTIIADGLNGDFKQEPFSVISNLIPYVNDLMAVKAVCGICKDINTANFSKRISDEDEKVVIGGADKYVAVCANCLYR